MMLRLAISTAVVCVFWLCSCRSGTQEIASSVSAIQKNAQETIVKTKDISVLSLKSKQRFDQIVLECEKATPSTAEISKAATDGSADSLRMLELCKNIVIGQQGVVKEVTDVSVALTSVQDIRPWWATLMLYGLVATMICATVFALWYTGVGSFIRGLLGIVTPRMKREADLAVATLKDSDPTSARELIAVKRATDPEFDLAFRKAKKTEDATHISVTMPKDTVP